MKKIPTLFVRDPDDMRHVLPEVHPDCGWVLAGEGVATRKYDGTCVMLDEHGTWWARREVKPGKTPPAGFVEVDYDPVTDKHVGWEPAEQSGWWKWLKDALDVDPDRQREPGTYELLGPKVNGNPERFGGHALTRHLLIRHALADRQTWYEDLPTDPAEALEYLRHELQDSPYFEGIVWHHPDGRMAKLKARDFR